MTNWQRKQRTYPAWFTIEITPEDVADYGSEEDAFAANIAFHDSAVNDGHDGIIGGAIAVDFRAEPEEETS